MKTEFEKMRSQELYDFSDPEIDSSLKHAKLLCARLQTMTPYDDDYRSMIEELIPDMAATASILPKACSLISGVPSLTALMSG